ncbi:hypothetical protein [Poriferisphaera sp. WC338]|uniref:hypothetical protein n=1 Tax=Poriferisphaera sp. WC338 TaxID=3425129 RepID=UPI003D819A87
MTDKQAHIPPFPAIRIAMKMIIVIVLGCAIGAMVTVGVGHAEQIILMLATAGFCLVGSLISLEPVRQASKVSIERVMSAYLLGMVLRIGVSFGGACFLVFGQGMEGKAAAVWTTVWYVLLLAVEVNLLVKFFNTATIDPTRRASAMEN